MPIAALYVRAGLSAGSRSVRVQVRRGDTGNLTVMASNWVSRVFRRGFTVGRGGQVGRCTEYWA